MRIEKEVTVILTVWKRYHLEEQIEALLYQSKPPYEIWIQQTQNHIDISDVLGKYSYKIRYSYCEKNKGVFGRFESVVDVKTEYVCIIDDDIIPGTWFLENAMNKSCELNAIISPNGRIINPTNYEYEKYIGDGILLGHSFCKHDTIVDYGNNAWLFKTEWIELFLQYPPLYRNNGEDIQLSASLKLHKDICTCVPSQIIPKESGNIKQSYSFDALALHKRQGFQDERNNVIQRFRDEGWRFVKENDIQESQENTPEISVVMFCSETRDNTLNSIRSIINQSFTDFEFIIVGNDVNRKFADIINEPGDSRIRLIDTKEDLEKYAVLNIGCGLAGGKYVCLAGNDFISVPDRLKIQYENMESEPETVASGTLVRFLSDPENPDDELTGYDSIISMFNDNKFVEETFIIQNVALEKIKYFKPLQGLDMFCSLIIRLAYCGDISVIPECLVETYIERPEKREAVIPPYYQKMLLSQNY